jgi:hypothetical protein
MAGGRIRARCPEQEYEVSGRSRRFTISSGIVNSILLTIDHFGRISKRGHSQDLVLTIGLLMQLRKDPYVMVADSLLL